MRPIPSTAAKPIRSRPCERSPAAAPISRSNRAVVLRCCGRPSTRWRSAGPAASSGRRRLGTEASFDVNGVMTTGKRIIGIIEGDSVPDLFIPSLVELHAQGRFPFDKLVKFYSLDQINQAAEDSEKGITIKPIVRLGS